MKCPRCSFHNADDAPFCQECGHVFLSSDRIPAVPDPAEAERRRRGRPRGAQAGCGSVSYTHLTLPPTPRA